MPELRPMSHDYLEYWLQVQPKAFLLAEVNEIRTAIIAIQGTATLASTERDVERLQQSLQYIITRAKQITDALNVALEYARHMDESKRGFMQGITQRMRPYRPGLTLACNIIQDWEQRTQQLVVIAQVRYKVTTPHTCLVAMIRWIDGESTSAKDLLQKAIEVADRWCAMPVYNQPKQIIVEDDIDGLPRNDVHGFYDALVLLTDDLLDLERERVAYRVQDVESGFDQVFGSEAQQDLFWIRSLRAMIEVAISCIDAQPNVVPARIRVALYELESWCQLQRN